MRAHPRSVGLLAIAAFGGLFSTTCAAPTQVRVSVYSDVDCGKSPIAGVVTGATLSELATNVPSASSNTCDGKTHLVGTLILQPKGSKDDRFAFQVVTRPDGLAPETCTAPLYQGCIVARRELRFEPHETLEVRVDLRLSCLDLPCDQASETCALGRCLSAQLPTTCGDRPCGETSLAGFDAAGCPTGLPGPPLVYIDAPGGSYCIDTTETTNSQFKAFLDTHPQAGLPADVCGWKSSFAADLSTAPDLPRVYVDWCDARAYCAYAHKRLCGKIGGGGLELTANATLLEDPQSQWYRACSPDGRSYPYGPAYDPQACDGSDAPNGLAPAGSFPRCAGGVPGLLDMSGSVHELEDNCDSAGAGDRSRDFCADRGGSWEHPPNEVACVSNDHVPRSEAGPDLGFRCCWPP